MDTADTPFAYTLTLYNDVHDSKYGEPYDVKLKIANKDNIEKYGKLVQDYENEKLVMKQWPKTGWRELHPANGYGGVAEGVMKIQWKGDTLYARNMSCPQDGLVCIGRLPKQVSPNNRTHILTREINYHPNGGQIFYPENHAEFIMLLAPPGDDVKMEDFVAFYFDGSCGVQIHPGTWHEAQFSLDQEAQFKDKQGDVHASVMMDTVVEFGRLFKVPLKPEFAEQ